MRAYDTPVTDDGRRQLLFLGHGGICCAHWQFTDYRTVINADTGTDLGSGMQCYVVADLAIRTDLNVGTNDAKLSPTRIGADTC
jgi:hypothetical protein